MGLGGPPGVKAPAVLAYRLDQHGNIVRRRELGDPMAQVEDMAALA